MVLGLALGIAAAGPLGWGFGAVLGVSMTLGGGVLLTDSPHRPARRR
ncbi:MAG: hypothetical protein LC798_13140 [Chloroflexi bacterium]|nr:hypothetical protein [Chloroflexota bacterium]